MMTGDLLNRVRRGIRKPPRVIFKRIYQEIADYTERYIAPKREKRLTLAVLLRKTDARSMEELWGKLSNRPYFSFTKNINLQYFETLCPEEAPIILARAQNAIDHRVDLLGSGLIDLGNAIDWHKDYKSGYSWAPQYIRDIDYNNPERPSDVKFPWELSRLQWLIPVGQAYLLTQDERFAQSVKEILIDWMRNNSYAYGVNWACTMEVALRVVTWTWFFHVFKSSLSWQENSFRRQFLTVLYLHGDFTERHLEYSDINGNHYLADAAGLVFAGLFFGNGNIPKRWQHKGWDILCRELPRQVFDDGVDFEASVPYHRLVLELFFFPALYRESFGLKTPKEYMGRLSLMADFSMAYIQPGGCSVPLWGDADDGRVLPFGNQSINDHRYLPGLVGHVWGMGSLVVQNSQTLGEYFWVLGEQAIQYIKDSDYCSVIKSRAFPQGGFYIMRNICDHVFIDCGPLGLAGRGGHGHNDCLAFEAVLDGVKLISDCGAYVYTASYQDRNLFRSTASHNTPCIDHEEMNRFIRWDYLWTLHNDAKPFVESWRTGDEYDVFCGTHSGYHRLIDPVTPKRTIALEHRRHRLIIQDEILCKNYHEVSIPFHLAPNVKASIEMSKKTVILESEGRTFFLYWECEGDWEITIIPTRISTSYGVFIPGQQLLWHAKITSNSKLIVLISPATLDVSLENSLLGYLTELLIVDRGT